MRCVKLQWHGIAHQRHLGGITHIDPAETGLLEIAVYPEGVGSDDGKNVLPDGRVVADMRRQICYVDFISISDMASLTRLRSALSAKNDRVGGHQRRLGLNRNRGDLAVDSEASRHAPDGLPCDSAHLRSFHGRRSRPGTARRLLPLSLNLGDVLTGSAGLA
jgi:hypothetical protein